MNVCTVGSCICDAQEWEGDTYCAAYYGIKEEVEEPPRPVYKKRYNRKYNTYDDDYGIEIEDTY